MQRSEKETAIEQIKVLDALISIAEVDIILNTFINTFIEKAILKDDGIYYIHGNFNLGGTVSGRLSSSNPNMQNFPSTSKYAKHIKRCFIAPPGFFMAGADFASLEDKISALTTKDPAKLKVYTDGYDGHCLRAFAYFKNEMPDIKDTVESINSIEQMYPKLRQKSKGPTFALTYQGTWKTLVNNLGLSENEAKSIEANYHILYTASDTWVHERLREATHVGYITVAFGLRVRTPILGQTILGARTTPYAAQAEGRTAGNALGQSYGLLNNRAGIEFHARLMAAPYRLDIFPISQIHDAGYFLIRESLEVTEWFNTNYVECMEWQELPEIQHDEVKLGGSIEVYYPNWGVKTTLPNRATQQEIKELFQ
jgi:DNA polymerase-1